YGSELVAADGLLQMTATGQIDGQFEKTGKRTREQIGDVAAIPLYAVTVKLNPKVIGRSVADDSDIHFLTLACELEPGCVRLQTAAGGAKVLARDSYAIICQAASCAELEAVLQKLVATVRIEWANKSGKVKKGAELARQARTILLQLRAL